MTQTELATTTEPEFITKFRILLTNTQTTLRELCVFYTKDVEEHPEHAEVYKDYFRLSAKTWRYIMLAGRGQAAPEIIFHRGRAINKLVACPVEEQTRYLNEPIQVLNPRNPSDHLLVNLLDLQKDQIAQVFGFDHVRTLPEQRAWLMSQESKTDKEKSEDAPRVPKVVNGMLVIYQPTKLTVAELTEYLCEMTKK